MSRLLNYILISLGILTLAGVTIASAHAGWFGGGFSNLSPEDIVERQETMFEKEADILGISVDEVKEAWAEGKTLMQIAEEKGITREQLQEKMEAQRKARMQEQLNILVENNVITQEQAQKRVNWFENRESGEGFRGHPCMGGGKGW
jgi:hypothetical protein